MFKKIIFSFIILTITMNNAELFSAELIEIKNANDLPVGQAIEAIFPDGQKRIVAAASAEIRQNGVSKTAATRIAEKMATVRAKAILADFIHGSKFKETTFMSEKLTSSHEQIYANEVVQYMQEKALRGVEIILINKKNPKKIIVVVGVSERSLEVSDHFQERIKNNSSQERYDIQYHDDLKQETEQRSWIHPSLR